MLLSPSRPNSKLCFSPHLAGLGLHHLSATILSPLGQRLNLLRRQRHIGSGLQAEAAREADALG